MSASLDLGPPKDSPGLLFLKAQFCNSPQWPPKDTDLTGKVALVTGSTGGLGLEASRQLLSYGLSSLIMAVRSTEKGDRIAADLRSQYPKADIKVWFLEMESYDSIQALARRADELARLDIAILNAGIQAAYFTTVPATGHEKYIQVNYLSTMLLAILLLPILKTKTDGPGRLSIVSSGTARGGTISFDRPILATLDDKSLGFNPVERYAVSKLLGHLFVMKLMEHVNADDVVVNLVDPGLVKNTDLQRGALAIVAAAFYCMKAIFGRSVPVGASTYVDAVAVKGKESHGCFVSSWKISS
jgi:NAD(P)-dependent dehydrogenase (short-subunit alcohol dehydrogenase family)